MKNGLNDQDPGRPKAVTNADEQEVAVNHSTADQGGYDEPSGTPQPAAKTQEEVKAEEEQKEKKSRKGPSSQTNKTF